MEIRRATEDGPSAHAPPRGMPTGWPWLLVAIAWALAIIATLTGQRELLDHHFLLEESGLPWPAAALVFLACWQVMIAAMMLPTSMPALVMMLGASRSQPHPARVGAAFLAGYAALWTAFALLAFAGDTLIHHTVDAWPWLAAHTFLIGATTLAIAGAFQFSRLKSRCLATCHAPQALFARGYRVGVRPAWWLGAQHGLSSVGCCWALMLIMFGLGVGGPGWMAALTVAMTVEERYAAARAPRLTLGVALVVFAALWLAHPAWLPTAAT